MRKKVGLVLGAGGARGFCHIGVIEVLQENGIPIDIVTGCSMGAMIGGGFASGVSCQEMRASAKQITTTSVFDVDIRNIRSNLRNVGGLAPGNRAMRIFKQFAGEKHIEECQISFAAIAADMRSQSLHVFKTGTVWQAVRASISIPVIFQPVEHEEKLLVDGGLLKRMPISEAREMGAEIIIAVDAIGPPRELRSSQALSILDASYQMLDWRSAQYEGLAADVLIVPELGDRSSFMFRNGEEAIQRGREATIAALPRIKQLVFN